MSFKLPPIPKIFLNTDIVVMAEIDGEDGPITTELYKGKCILDETSKQFLNAQKEMISLSALIIIPGDISLNKDIQGTCMVNGINRNIRRSQRPRNPDGSVHHTELWVE